MKLTVHNTTGKNSTMTVSDSIFAQKPNEQLIAQAVRVYLSNQRQGTSKVKTRSEVIRSKKKWFKQKGTGNARHGSRNPNIFVGGGVAHGPSGKENWSLKLTKNLKKKALVSVLSKQVEHVVVCSDIEKLDGKTSSGSRLLKAISPKANKILVVVDAHDEKVSRSLNNIPYVLVTKASRLTALEIAMADSIIFTKKAIESLEEKLQ